MTKTRTRLLPAAVFLSLLAAPASALGASATITDDAGNAVPVQAGMTLRNMAPDINFTLGSGEFYAARVVGPGGAPASTGTACTSFASAERVKYQGNGTYTLFLKSGGSRDACNAAAEQSVPFTINASTAITPPSRQPLFTRQAGSFSAIDYAVPVSLNPGADSYDFKYAANAVLGADGGITNTDAQSGIVDTETGTARVSFSKPGRYTFVVRAKSFRSDVPTAWSQRVDVTVVAPFDLSSTFFPDSRGPSYKIAGTVRERAAKGGRVTISLGKGSKAKKFRRIGRAKVRSGGKFSLRFKIRRPGKYTLRYSFGGNASVAKGSAKEVITIRRRFF